jgi:CcmD family protein
MKRLLTLLMIISFTILHAHGQDPAGIEMADTWRSNGKINVVIAVLAVIFLGLFVYLIGIDRKLRRMEDKKGS